ncbi:hypothetical protein ASPCAL14068 [Aspergillus calidoustus]|uniref:Zn(2)-C6 fungal-type domain-containing protein n=1 Tax=Aspergillus calidoustus TaxID=454130 RepID=A0A0U5GEW4_ASPCI|nr:hypothetical protein ASPCAL14068 [Aspergillus calidoustus]
MDSILRLTEQEAAWLIPAPNNEAADARKKKKRSSGACARCRERKVRCDVQVASPCTNCKLDHIPCTVPTKKSRHGVPVRRRKPGGHRKSDSETSCQPQPRDRRPKRPAARRLNIEETSSEGSQNGLPTLDDQSSPDPVGMLQDEAQIPPWGLAEHISLLAQAPFAAATGQLEQWHASNTVSLSGTQSPLPSCIRDHPSTICSRGADYLTRLGCYSIPSARLRHELITTYLRFMHPKLPLFDLPRLCASMNGLGQSFQISLLVFQAIMFAGAALVNMHHLQREGYRSRAEARKALYHRVRLLYDYRYEHDTVAVFQALLIVTYSAGHIDHGLPTPVERARPQTTQDVAALPGERPVQGSTAGFPFQSEDNPASLEHILDKMTREGEISDEMPFPSPESWVPALSISDNFPTFP